MRISFSVLKLIGRNAAVCFVMLLDTIEYCVLISILGFNAILKAHLQLISFLYWEFSKHPLIRILKDFVQ